REGRRRAARDPPEGAYRGADDDRPGTVRDGTGRPRLLPVPRQGVRLFQRRLPAARLSVWPDLPAGGGGARALQAVSRLLKPDRNPARRVLGSRAAIRGPAAFAWP